MIARSAASLRELPIVVRVEGAMRRTAAALLILALVGAGLAADDEIWGPTAAGLRLRADAPPQPIGGSPLLANLDFELRNDLDEAVPHDRVGIRPQLRTAKGEPLPAGIMELPTITPLAVRSYKLEAGKSVRWIPRLMRTREDAPKRLTLTAVTHVSDLKHQSHFLKSLPFKVDLSERPAPRPLTKEDLDAGWTGGSVLVYRVDKGNYGSRTLEVWPDGTARCFRTRHGAEDPEFPPGLHKARLSAAQQAEIAAMLRRHEVWTLTDTPPPTSPRLHATHVKFIAISGEGAVIARLRLAEDEDYVATDALRKSLRAVMVSVAKQAKAAKQNKQTKPAKKRR